MNLERGAIGWLVGWLVRAFLLVEKVPYLSYVQVCGIRFFFGRDHVVGR